MFNTLYLINLLLIAPILITIAFLTSVEWKLIGDI